VAGDGRFEVLAALPDIVSATAFSASDEADESLLADLRADLAIIERPGDRLGEDAEAVLDEVMRSTLAAAVGEV
jgi:hypothetical protein